MIARAAYRAFEVLLAVVLLVITLPLVAVAAAAILLEDGRPVIYGNERVGRGGRRFVLYKLRSMRRVPAREVAAISSLGERAHPERDERVTRVGSLLRKSSLDEVPNLLNVLAGQMALVGPRPEEPENLARYRPEDAAALLTVKPGVTSLSKVSGRDDLTYEETIALDVKYVRERSVRLDLSILARTVFVVLRMSGH